MAPSLKRQLLLWLLVPLLAIVPINAALQYWFALAPAEQEFDHQLGDYAIAVSSFVRVNGDRVSFDMAPQAERLLRTDQLDKEFFLVIGPDGATIAGDLALNTPEQAVAAGELRYADRQIGGRTLRLLIYGMECGPGTCQVRIAETLVKRTLVRSQAFIATVMSILVLGITTIGVMLAAVRHSLQPLGEIRAQLAERSLDDPRPLDVPRAPIEVQPLIVAINRLFERLSIASRAQKTFLADVAHQLRTPLSVLQTESELALMRPHPASLNATLHYLHRSAVRASHLVTQLLALARADPDAQLAPVFSLVDLKDLGSDAANEWSRQAFAADVDLGFQLEPAPIRGQFVLLRELLSNLIHNAIEHAGTGCQITVKTYVAHQHSILEVEDNGPGIDANEQQRVLQRFVRGRNAAGLGSGLGLAIVSDVARIHKAEVTLGSPGSGKGLLVRVSFQTDTRSGSDSLPAG